MTIPSYIEKHVRNYTNKKSEKSFNIVVEWLERYTDIYKDEIEDIFIAETPLGECQNGDRSEYCLQWKDRYDEDGDSFQGYYFHKMRESDVWLGYEYKV